MEFTVDEPGGYLVVNHAFGRALHVAIAILQAEQEAAIGTTKKVASVPLLPFWHPPTGYGRSVAAPCTFTAWRIFSTAATTSSMSVSSPSNTFCGIQTTSSQISWVTGRSSCP